MYYFVCTKERMQINLGHQQALKCQQINPFSISCRCFSFHAFMKADTFAPPKHFV